MRKSRRDREDLVDRPRVRQALEQAEITETDQYTGTITWSPVEAPYLGDQVYTATITLVAKAGFTSSGQMVKGEKSGSRPLVVRGLHMATLSVGQRMGDISSSVKQRIWIGVMMTPTLLRHMVMGTEHGE